VKISVYMCGLTAALVSLCAAVGATAAEHKNILSEQARAVDGGRSVQVLVAQEEIKSDINQSNIVVATGGGLLGALIDAGINSERAKKAEAAIQPVRAALAGYDVDALAQATTSNAIAKTPWFQPRSSAFGRDTTILGKSAALDASPTAQVAFFEYAYDTSPDFSSIRVSMTVQMASKAIPTGKKPEFRLQPKALAYAQTVTSVVSLASPSKVATENAAQWAADGGKLARKALAAGFDEVGLLIPRALTLSEADLTAMSAKDKKVALLGGYSGRIQEEAPSGTLLFTGGLVHVQTISQ